MPRSRRICAPSPISRHWRVRAASDAVSPSCGIACDGTAGVPTQAIPQDGETASDAARTRQWREIGLGAQILRDLGITSIRLLSSAKLTYVGLAGFGIEILSTETLDG